MIEYKKQYVVSEATLNTDKTIIGNVIKTTIDTFAKGLQAIARQFESSHQPELALAA